MAIMQLEIASAMCSFQILVQAGAVNFSYKMDGLLWKVVVKNKPFTCKFDTSMNHTRVWGLAASVCVCVF